MGHLHDTVTWYKHLTGEHTKTLWDLDKIKYRKIPKISPGAYIFQMPFLRGLSMEGNLRFKID